MSATVSPTFTTSATEGIWNWAKETFLAAGADGVLLNLSQLPQWLEEQV